MTSYNSIHTGEEIDNFDSRIDTYTDEKLFLTAYPVGSIICMSTNTAPSYGTWSLIDKQFRYTRVENFTPTLNTTNCTTASVGGFCTGHTVFIGMSFTNKVAITDAALQMFTIPPSNFGVTNFLWSRRWAHFTDAGNGVIYMSMSVDGIVQTNDIIIRGSSSTSLAADTVIGSNELVLPINYNNIQDSWCDKFYFKRTA